MARDEYLGRIDRWLERIDGRLDRIDGHMERGNQLMERGNQLMDANRQAFEASRQAFEDLRVFLRELTLRQERVFGSMIERLDGQTAEIRASTEMIREHRREFIEESRAGRAALFRILDRLDEGGSAAGA